MTLKLALGLVALAALAQKPGPNPMTVTIRPPTLDVAATQVRLLALDDDAAKTQEILADDAESLAPILPYTVLIKNESARKLRAVGVTFRWTATDDLRHPRSLTLTLTAMANANDPGQISPGEYQLFTPVQTINQYLAQSPPTRPGVRFGERTTTPAIGQFTTLTLAQTIQQGIDQMMIASGSAFEAYLDGVVFEDYSYVGSPRLRQILIQHNNLIH